MSLSNSEQLFFKSKDVGKNANLCHKNDSRSLFCFNLLNTSSVLPMIKSEAQDEHESNLDHSSSKIIYDKRKLRFIISGGFE